MSKEEKKYSASSIKVMEGLEAVRKRPGMYIGSTDSKGLHHLVYEVVDNSVDEALGGHCKNISIILHNDSSCSIEDDGRGIPTGIHPTEGISAAEVVLTKLHAGGKFDKDSYAFSGGLHGVGVSVVNALSEWLELKIFQNGNIYTQRFEKGKAIGSLKISGKSDKHGTLIRFMPDKEIFKHTTNLSFETLSKRFQEIAFLNKSLNISILDERTNEKDSYCYENGIVSFIEFLNKNKVAIFDEIIFFSDKSPQFEVECAIQYNSDYDEKLFSFVNNINTFEGGTHVSGFKSALTSACNKKAKDLNILGKEESFSSEDVREGLVCILSIKISEPQFEGQTKAKLGNFDVKGIVHSIILTQLDTFFEEKPSIARKILAKAEMALKAREAAKRARELTRKKSGIELSILPGKLSDCSSDEPEKNEIFIVEGDSAGGSAKTARDRFTQAILPLRGKILNVEKCKLEKILANEEIKSLIAAIGIGVGNDTTQISECRYHKIIIMTDADVDGSHIRTLLLTFFYRYLKPTIENGFLYIAQPPLYKAKIGKQDMYLQNDEELMNLILKWAQTELTVFINGNLISNEEKNIFFKNILEIYHLLNSSYGSHNMSIRGLEEKIISQYQNKEVQNPIDENNELIKKIKEIKIWENILFLHNDKEINTMAHFSPLDICEIAKMAAKPHMNIQRYKGLGEMNAEQLWETAMDPSKRQLLKVKIEDAEKADHWFNILMGDDAAPRKIFIEERAHFVKHLDI
jgi:DNA gyrase subunit B